MAAAFTESAPAPLFHDRGHFIGQVYCKKADYLDTYRLAYCDGLLFSVAHVTGKSVSHIYHNDTGDYGKDDALLWLR